jgi:large subunit ribosomal protein L35
VRSLPKQKTHKGVAKRFKATAGGKVVRGHSMRSHNFSSKTTKRKRALRKPTTVEGRFARMIKKLMPYA